MLLPPQDILEATQKRPNFLSLCILGNLVYADTNLDNALYHAVIDAMIEDLRNNRSNPAINIERQFLNAVNWIIKSDVAAEIAILFFISAYGILNKKEKKSVMKTETFNTFYSSYRDILKDYL